MTVIFGLLWFFVKKELIKFESPSDCIFACGSSEDLKIAKELYEKYNISHKNINSVDTSKDTENKKSNNLKKGENHDYI
ncbi:hypothetical protein KY321_05050 [Candidatus Woesearchaeota archaeon]|nr:hypothetical protein [Candidatus Woesearchaeota archaeon]